MLCKFHKTVLNLNCSVKIDVYLFNLMKIWISFELTIRRRTAFVSRVILNIFYFLHSHQYFTFNNQSKYFHTDKHIFGND